MSVNIVSQKAINIYLRDTGLHIGKAISLKQICLNEPDVLSEVYCVACHFHATNSSDDSVCATVH